MKKFIRWAGNKSRMLTILSKHVPQEYNRYIEPFLGSGALFLHLDPKKWIINDINKDLMGIWNTVAMNPEKLINHLKKLSDEIRNIGVEQRKAYLHSLTESIPKMRASVRKSAVILFISHLSYASHIMRNHRFYFPGIDSSVEFSKLRVSSVEYAHNIMNIHKKLCEKGGMIMNMSYQDVLKKARENDFVFLDPPYIENHKYQLNYNIDEELNMGFLEGLKREVTLLDTKKVKWMMTQADTEDVRRIFGMYNVIQVKVYRGYSNSFKNELIIKNY